MVELEFLYPFGDGAEVVKQHILILGKAENFPPLFNSTRQLAIATNKPKTISNTTKRARLYRAGSPLQSRYQCRGKNYMNSAGKLDIFCKGCQ